MLKIRLRRMGAKFQPTYRVVVADSRAPRDGAFIAVLGFYNPRTDPPTIQIDATALQDWIRKGAQPTDSLLSILDTGNIAPDVVARFTKRLIGAGGKRGAGQPTAPAAAEEAGAPAAETAETTPAAAEAGN